MCPSTSSRAGMYSPFVRFSVHLEALADLPFMVHATLSAEGVNPTARDRPSYSTLIVRLSCSEARPAVPQSPRQLRRRPPPHCLQLHLLPRHHRRLRALSDRFTTGGEGFDCWLDILIAVESVTGLHWRVVNTSNCTALSFLRAAFEIEVEETLVGRHPLRH